MKTFAAYIALVILIIGTSWFGWWSLIDNELVAKLKLGDLFVLWRKFNESFMTAAGVGAAAVLILASYQATQDKGKTEVTEVSE